MKYAASCNFFDSILKRILLCKTEHNAGPYLNKNEKEKTKKQKEKNNNNAGPIICIIFFLQVRK